MAVYFLKPHSLRYTSVTTVTLHMLKQAVFSTC